MTTVYQSAGVILSMFPRFGQIDSCGCSQSSHCRPISRNGRRDFSCPFTVINGLRYRTAALADS